MPTHRLALLTEPSEAELAGDALDPNLMSPTAKALASIFSIIIDFKDVDHPKMSLLLDRPQVEAFEPTTPRGYAAKVVLVDTDDKCQEALRCLACQVGPVFKRTMMLRSLHLDGISTVDEILSMLMMFEDLAQETDAIDEWRTVTQDRSLIVASMLRSQVGTSSRHRSRSSHITVPDFSLSAEVDPRLGQYNDWVGADGGLGYDSLETGVSETQQTMSVLSSYKEHWRIFMDKVCAALIQRGSLHAQGTLAYIIGLDYAYFTRYSPFLRGLEQYQHPYLTYVVVADYWAILSGLEAWYIRSWGEGATGRYGTEAAKEARYQAKADLDRYMYLQRYLT